MTMKKAAWAIVPMMLIAVTSWGDAEVLRHLDVSGGDHEGHWVMFFSKAMSPNAPMGTAGAAAGKGETLEAAFGLVVKNSRPSLSVVTKEQINALRDDESAPATTITLIDVTPEQYAKAKAAIDKYSAVEEQVDTAPNVAMNLAYEVFKELPVKQPYRSGLGSTTVLTYYEDIGTLNRKLAKEGS